MFKIFSNIKEKTENKIQEYAQKDIDGLSRIINKPIDGEVIEIKNIIINKCFKKPNDNKLKERRKYYKKYKYFKVPVILDDMNYLVDGYTTYLLAKEYNFEFLTIMRKD